MKKHLIIAGLFAALLGGKASQAHADYIYTGGCTATVGTSTNITNGSTTLTMGVSATQVICPSGVSLPSNCHAIQDPYTSYNLYSGYTGYNNVNPPRIICTGNPTTADQSAGQNPGQRQTPYENPERAADGRPLNPVALLDPAIPICSSNVAGLDPNSPAHGYCICPAGPSKGLAIAMARGQIPPKDCVGDLPICSNNIAGLDPNSPEHGQCVCPAGANRGLAINMTRGQIPPAECLGIQPENDHAQTNYSNSMDCIYAGVNCSSQSTADAMTQMMTTMMLMRMMQSVANNSGSGQGQGQGSGSGSGSGGGLGDALSSLLGGQGQGGQGSSGGSGSGFNGSGLGGNGSGSNGSGSNGSGSNGSGGTGSSGSGSGAGTLNAQLVALVSRLLSVLSSLGQGTPSGSSTTSVAVQSPVQQYLDNLQEEQQAAAEQAAEQTGTDGSSPSVTASLAIVSSGPTVQQHTAVRFADPNQDWHGGTDSRHGDRRLSCGFTVGHGSAAAGCQ